MPGKPEESLLVEAINYDGLEMPPTGKLEPGEIAVLTRWVSLGAPGPAAIARPTPRRRHRPIHAIEAHRGRPRVLVAPAGSQIARTRARPTPGAGDWADWSRNPIDRFILKALLDHGLTPAPEADKPTLIRRATFDLTGLPPTPEEVDAFLADKAPEAYERLIDRLLASPRYGQRWARHWLDLVRYAESDGYRQDAFRPKPGATATMSSGRSTPTSPTTAS